MGRVFVFLSTLGPIGTRLPAPGTFGTLFGLLVFFHLVFHWNAHPWTIAIFFFPLFITGIFICGEAEKVMEQKDPSSVIWDEFVAVPYIFITIPEEISFQDGNSSLIWLLLGFILFRFFDIVKPLGINSLQKVKNGFGVMIDDFLAAAYSALSLLALKTFPLSFF
mgnify:CR=1 FL=1